FAYCGELPSPGSCSSHSQLRRDSRYPRIPSRIKLQLAAAKLLVLPGLRHKLTLLTLQRVSPPSCKYRHLELTICCLETALNQTSTCTHFNYLGCRKRSPSDKPSVKLPGSTSLPLWWILIFNLRHASVPGLTP
ncbi:hypothetical protein AMECASPLE_031157, partial [Ameca splendens]